ncbi:helix-turn-helix domain-containing protein [[Clostridium] scindens]|uniref:helix-turn-helix domain-containing protein n=1 Tax=Clostridium scindens (strain JCM 10418 / VPI 12708) TaxID=29347 RepID=UPI00399F408E
MEINDRIQQVRNSLKMSRRAFGEVLGVSGDVINNIENNRLKRPEQKEPIYKLICEKYNVDEIWLRTGEGEMFVKIDKENLLMEWAGSVLGSSDESFKKRFVKMLSELDESDWETLEKIATKLHKNG